MEHSINGESLAVILFQGHALHSFRASLFKYPDDSFHGCFRNPPPTLSEERNTDDICSGYLFPWRALNIQRPSDYFTNVTCCGHCALPCIYPWSMSLVVVLPSFPVRLCTSVIRQDNPKLPWNPPQVLITSAMGNSLANPAFIVSYKSLGSILNYMKCPFEGWVN